LHNFIISCIIQIMKKTSFTTILHDKRKELGLNLIEYCVADTIYNLSSNPSSPVQGWCYAAKETLADILDTTRQTIHSSINRLIDKGLVEKNEETKYLRTTSAWFDTVITTERSEKQEKQGGKLKPYFRGSFCRKDNFTGKWKVKEKNEWLELADGYEKEIQWKR